jgi:hypothetical protein
MKTFIKTGVILSISLTMLLWNCEEADKEFVHDSNTIDKLVCRAKHETSPFEGLITEYNKNGDPVNEEFEQKDVEGGYGIITIEVPERFSKEVDLENVYLYATLSWDQSITPSLSGRHDITGDGIVITVTSGIGTKRNYRIRGYFD